MKLDTWLQKIQTIHPVGWDLGLERVGQVGRKLDLLHPAQTVFLIAGTNGKGSTCEYLARLCTAKGLSYGKTTSPFLLTYNEQIVVNGKPVSDADIVAAFEEIDAARGDITLTYFEFGALAALLVFKLQQLDVAIVEIGLGGRLDAMNIISPDVSIITRVAMDHEAWLGNDRETIAREKAGIMRPGKPVVLVDPEPPVALFTEAERTGADVHRLGEQFDLVDDVFRRDDTRLHLKDLKLPIYSAVAALEAMFCAGYPVTVEELSNGFLSASLPGRFQLLEQQPRVILDVAHNPDAAQLLARQLRAVLPEGKPAGIHAVTAMYADKDAAAVFRELAPLVDVWHLADLPMERGASAAALGQILQEATGSAGVTYDKVSSAYESAVRQCHDDDTILVFGSFPAVAGVLDYLAICVP